MADPRTSFNLSTVCWCGHSFLKTDRVKEAFPDFDPLLVSRGGLTYRELIDGDRSQGFRNSIEKCLRQRGGTVLVLVLGDNDFSTRTLRGIEKNEHYDEMEANPVRVVKTWRDKALDLAVSVGASHVILTPVFPRYFAKKPTDEDVKPPRRKRSNKAFYEETRGLPWCVDSRNWHNHLARQVNRQLRNIIGTKWRSYYRDGRSVNMAVLDSNPLGIMHPRHFTEWETKDSLVRCCVHPNADTFANYYLEPVRNLLSSLE